MDSEIIDLSGWQISDSATSTKPFIIPEATLIQPNELLLFKRPQTKITLNNNGDAVKLFYPNADLAQEINYTDSQEGWSVAREKAGSYTWTSQPTPGAINIIKQEIKKTTAPLPKKSSLAPAPTPEANAQNNITPTPNMITVDLPDEPTNNTNQTPIVVGLPPINQTIPTANNQPNSNQTLSTAIVENASNQSPTDSQLSPTPEQLSASMNSSAESSAKNRTSAWGKTTALAVLIAGFGAIILVNVRRRLH